MDAVQEILHDLDKRISATRKTPPGTNLPLPEAAANPCVFIDGSNGEILPLSAGSLSFFRVVAVHYAKKLTKKQKSECYCLAFQGETTTLKTVPQIRIPQQINDKELGSSLNSARRLAELAFAEDMAKNLTNTCIILDGSLDMSTKEEENSLLSLLNTCQQRKNTLIGFSKTSSFTYAGEYLSTLLVDAPGTWLFPWQSTYFVKLHPKSGHVFRVDIKGDVDRALSTLRFFAKDPVFFGYPYPLILADKYAKITQKELQAQRALFATKAGKLWQRLKKESSAMNAHATIDAINKNG